jgi:hypothetical protein
MSQPTVNQVYAINGDDPPQTWMSQASFIGFGEGPSPEQPPTGFWAVDQDTWQTARDSQTRSLDRAQAQAEYDNRLALSSQRHALVDAGLTYEVACILVPDPTNDYSIDTWHNA